jgi:cell division protein FtsI/penicillin-binding protein 2
MLSDRRVLAVLLVLAMGAVVAAGVVVAPKFLGDDTPEAEANAQEFLEAWGEGDLEAMAARVQDPPATFADDYTAITEGLNVESADYELGDVRRSGDVAIANFEAHLQITGVGEWSYPGRMRLELDPDAAEGDPDWLVKWSPATIHPDLEADQRLRATREWPERGAINGSDGKPLAPSVPGRIVGLQPNAVTDLNVVKLALQAELGVTPAEVDEALNAPGVQPDHFVPIITITEDVYNAHEAVIYPLPGTRFRDTTVRSGPTAGFAQHVLGRTGEATAERLEELGGPYQPGDVVGITGLEARYETALAGTPSSQIQALGGADEVLATIDTVEGRAPVTIDTTIDRDVQTAVERSLEGVTKPAAIVVTDAKGNVRAVASRPLDDDLNRALGGAYPPGSTFKVVTTDALLGNGITPETTVNCPQTANVGGKSFKNFEGGQLGAIPFSQAFAESCNTAFVTAIEDVADDQAVAAAERFGFNAEYSVGLNTVGGSYPAPADTTEKAAQAIGQGRVTASPLHMATVAGAVMDGSWEPPTLLVDPPAEDTPADADAAAEGGAEGTDTTATTAAAGGSTTVATTAPADGDGDGAAAAEPTTIDAGHRQELAGLMRLVVSDGSGKNAAVPGHDVGGKTGTAEFGDTPPLPTHAWFIGFSDNLSFAVFVEDGGVGGRDAAPIAGRMIAGF